MPRDGKNITLPQVEHALMTALHMDRLAAGALTSSLPPLCRKDGTFDLVDTRRHNVIEHDSSFTRLDFHQGDNRTRVINLSLGGDSSTETERRAIESAIQAGIVVVAAAGNANRPVVDFPAALPGMIAVAATDERKQRARYSSYGPEVSVVAPGSVNTGFGRSGSSGKDFATKIQPEDVAAIVAMLVTQPPQSFISEVLVRPTKKQV